MGPEEDPSEEDASGMAGSGVDVSSSGAGISSFLLTKLV